MLENGIAFAGSELAYENSPWREAGTGIETIRAIKLALDPYGILNPGKIV